MPDKTNDPGRTNRRSSSSRDDPEISLDLSLGNLFKGIGSLFDLAVKLDEGRCSEVVKQGEITDRSGKLRALFGLSIRTGIGGTTSIDQFGNIKRTPDGPVIEEVREPLVDVFDEGDRIVVIAEMPGADEDKIEVKINGDVLSLNARGEESSYAREILLPAAVHETPAKSEYKNGVLRLVLVRLPDSGTSS